MLATGQLQIGIVVNLGVAEQGFPLCLTGNDIADLIESFEPAVLPKVDADGILHANLDP